VPSVPPRNLRPGFEANPAKPSPGGFEAQPTKPPRVAYSIRVPRHSTRVTSVLNCPGAKSSRASLDLHVSHLDSVNMVTPMYTCACRCPRCQPPRLVTRPPGPSVQASRPSFTTPGPSARHGTTSFTSPSTTASELHTCTPKTKRHVAQPNSRHG